MSLCDRFKFKWWHQCLRVILVWILLFHTLHLFRVKWEQWQWKSLSEQPAKRKRGKKKREIKEQKSFLAHIKIRGEHHTNTQSHCAFCGELLERFEGGGGGRGCVWRWIKNAKSVPNLQHYRAVFAHESWVHVTAAPLVMHQNSGPRQALRSLPQIMFLGIPGTQIGQQIFNGVSLDMFKLLSVRLPAILSTDLDPVCPCFATV